jgi:S-adenosylmethionine hydrolase
MGRRYDSVSFLTDWGLVDEFVGVAKSVIRDLAPHVTVTDLSHQIPHFDVRAGGLALARSVSYLPSGIVLAVVDPGVGSSRKAIAIEVAGGDGVMVGPDNGLLAPAVAMAGGAGRAVSLTNPDFQLEAPGATFAGRDIFAPAAAHLCNGVDLYQFGEPLDPDLLVPGMVPLPRTEGDAVLAEVLWIDQFGNCQLNLGPDEVEGWGPQVRVVVGEHVRVATLASSFAAIDTGAIGLVPDSCGMLALVVDRRSAAEELGLGTGAQVTLSPLGDGETRPAITTAVSMRAPR